MLLFFFTGFALVGAVTPIIRYQTIPVTGDLGSRDIVDSYCLAIGKDRFGCSSAGAMLYYYNDDVGSFGMNTSVPLVSDTGVPLGTIDSQNYGTLEFWIGDSSDRYGGCEDWTVKGCSNGMVRTSSGRTRLRSCAIKHSLLCFCAGGFPDSTPNPTTIQPSLFPSTQAPTRDPTAYPTLAPTLLPTRLPTSLPTMLPTKIPSVVPTIAPTLNQITATPTSTPTIMNPTFTPTTLNPTKYVHNAFNIHISHFVTVGWGTHHRTRRPIITDRPVTEHASYLAADAGPIEHLRPHDDCTDDANEPVRIDDTNADDMTDVRQNTYDRAEYAADDCTDVRRSHLFIPSRWTKHTVPG